MPPHPRTTRIGDLTCLYRWPVTFRHGLVHFAMGVAMLALATGTALWLKNTRAVFSLPYILQSIDDVVLLVGTFVFLGFSLSGYFGIREAKQPWPGALVYTVTVLGGFVLRRLAFLETVSVSNGFVLYAVGGVVGVVGLTCLPLLVLHHLTPRCRRYRRAAEFVVLGFGIFLASYGVVGLLFYGWVKW